MDKVNALSPDLVILGGDYVNRTYRISAFFMEINRLISPHGVFAVLGNHDHWANKDWTYSCMSETQVKSINNDSVWIEKGGQRIKLGGVGDMIEDEQDFAATSHDLRPDDFVILVSHNPDYIETSVNENIDVQISGHTHGGQLTFFGLWAPVTHSKFYNKYKSGFHKVNQTQLIVSNGLGTGWVPLRFFAPPQIVEVILSRTNR